MPRCYKCCKYYSPLGCCTKYKEIVPTSKNFLHYDLLIHPLNYLTIYYKSGDDVQYLIELAEKYLTDSTSKSVCGWYRRKGYITFKQRKFLLHQFFDCYTAEEEKHYSNIELCQVED